MVLEALSSWICLQWGWLFGITVWLPLDRGLIGGVQRVTLATVLALPFLSIDSTAPVAWIVLPLAVLGGALASLPIALAVATFEMSGVIFESSRGQMLAAAYTGLSVGSVTSVGRALAWGAWVVVLQSGFFERCVTLEPAIYRAENELIGIGRALFAAIGNAWETALELALPLAIVFVGVDFFIGFLGQLVPRLFLFVEAFILKTLLGFGFIYWATFSTSGEWPLRLLSAPLAGLGGGAGG